MRRCGGHGRSPLGPMALADRRLILCYHAVSPRWPADVAVAPDRLTDQLQTLTDQGYRAVTFSELVSLGPDQRAVAITFDDGYRSVVTLAGPILNRFDIRATVFLPTDFVGAGPIAWPRINRWLETDHRDELETMSWQDARRLRDRGWEIGSHTRSHPRLTELPNDQLDEELVGSRTTCEQSLGVPCTALAFPFGDHDERVVSAAAAAGYSAAATLSAANGQTSSLRCPRVPILRFDGPRLFKIKTSGLVRRSTVLTPLARAARHLNHLAVQGEA